MSKLVLNVKYLLLLSFLTAIWNTFKLLKGCIKAKEIIFRSEKRSDIHYSTFCLNDMNQTQVKGSHNSFDYPNGRWALVQVQFYPCIQVIPYTCITGLETS